MPDPPTSLPKSDVWYSVFFSFDADNYEHLVLMADVHSPSSDGSRVLIYDPCDVPRNEGPLLLSEPRALSVEIRDDEDFDWLQDEIVIPDWRVQFEISGYAIEEAYDGLRGIWRDGKSYLFLSSNPQDLENAGALLLQDT